MGVLGAELAAIDGRGGGGGGGGRAHLHRPSLIDAPAKDRRGRPSGAVSQRKTASIELFEAGVQRRISPSALLGPGGGCIHLT